MIRLLRRVSVLASIAALSACSATTAEEQGAGHQALLIKVDLPQGVGGGTRLTRTAPHTTSTKRYALGALRSRAATKTGTKLHPRAFTGADVPAAADVSRGAPEPGDQGETQSCSTWASGYSAMGWWAAREKLPGAPFAPMFLYSQLTNGNCEEGTVISDGLDLLATQGITSATSYQPMQARLDCSVHAQSAAQSANAAQHRITGYDAIDLDDPRTSISAALASGRPVILGIMVYDNLMNATAESFLVDAPPAGSTAQGAHAITAFSYDAKGVWILNSWTKSWGWEGWAELSWDFITGREGGTPNVMDGQVIRGVVGGTTTTP